jgi:hypothetical protein
MVPTFPWISVLWGSLKDKMHFETQRNATIRGESIISPTANRAEMRQVVAWPAARSAAALSDKHDA